jgi:hypothetical protein
MNFNGGSGLFNPVTQLGSDGSKKFHTATVYAVPASKIDFFYSFQKRA